MKTNHAIYGYLSLSILLCMTACSQHSNPAIQVEFLDLPIIVIFDKASEPRRILARNFKLDKKKQQEQRFFERTRSNQIEVAYIDDYKDKVSFIGDNYYANDILSLKCGRPLVENINPHPGMLSYLFGPGDAEVISYNLVSSNLEPFAYIFLYQKRFSQV